MVDWFIASPPARGARGEGAFTRGDAAAAAGFYRNERAAATPLHRLRGLASEIGLGEILVKDESARFGLSAFKVLGVRYAVARLLSGAATTLAAVTAGNHGRAVARVARERGLPCEIVVPAGTVAARIDAIRSEGAKVTISPHGYDEAVAALAHLAPARGWTIISDTSWPGYESIPRDIMAGYTWLMEEAREQWPRVPDVVIVQAGVGGLAAAVTEWLSLTFGAARPFAIVCEPVGAACVMASLRRGERTTLAQVGETHMAGLKCGEVSPLAWASLQRTVDAAVSIPDTVAEDAMARLAAPPDGDPQIAAGSAGACGVGALMAIMRDPVLRPVRDAARLDSQSTVLTIVTESAIDRLH